MTLGLKIVALLFLCLCATVALCLIAYAALGKPGGRGLLMLIGTLIAVICVIAACLVIRL